MKKADPGLTYLDDTPVEIPVRMRKAALEGDRFKELVQRFSEYQAQQGEESLEESDDFDVPDEEPDFVSRYEMTEMHEDGGMDDASFRAKRGKFFPGDKRTESVHKKDLVDKDKNKDDNKRTVNGDRNDKGDDNGDKDGEE